MQPLDQSVNIVLNITLWVSFVSVAIVGIMVAVDMAKDSTVIKRSSLSDDTE